MKIKTFAVEKYRGYPIYYRNFLDHFEYFTIINNELYTAQIKVRPHWLTKLFYYFDVSSNVDKLPYSQQQLKNIIRHLRIMAETTIETVLKEKENKK